MILTIAIACLRSSRIAWARIILQSTDTPIWRIFRYDSKCSLTSFKRRRKKKCISKLEKRKHLFGALQITSTHSHAHSSSLFSHSQKKKKYATRILLSSVPENDFWNLCRYSYVTRYYKFRYFIRTIYISASSILALSRSLSYSRFLHLYQAYLSIYTISLLYILPPAIQCFMVFTLCTFLSIGLWRKRVGCWSKKYSIL